MHQRLLKIFFFILVSFCAKAQSAADSSYNFSSIASFKLTDVKQQENVYIKANGKKFSLFVFLSPECPLSQNYTKTLNEIYNKFHKRVNVFGIVPGDAYTTKEVAAFGLKYNVEFKLLIDIKQKLTHYLEATVTPQAILIGNKSGLVYTGAIDDWVQALGKKRAQVSQHYVVNAIEQSLHSEVLKVKKTNAIGCKINDY